MMRLWFLSIQSVDVCVWCLRAGKAIWLFQFSYIFFRPANSSKHRHFAFISHLRAYDPWSAHLMPINNRLLIEIYSELILIGSEKLFAAERGNEQANKWISHWHSWSLAHRPKIKITKNDERKFVSCYTGFAEFLTTKVTTQDERFQNPLCILPIDLYEQFSIFATLHWVQLAELWLNSMRVEQMEKRKNTKRTAKNIWYNKSFTGEQCEVAAKHIVCTIVFAHGKKERNSRYSFIRGESKLAQKSFACNNNNKKLFGNKHVRPSTSHCPISVIDLTVLSCIFAPGIFVERHRSVVLSGDGVWNDWFSNCIPFVRINLGSENICFVANAHIRMQMGGYFYLRKWFHNVHGDNFRQTNRMAERDAHEKVSSFHFIFAFPLYIGYI